MESVICEFENINDDGKQVTYKCIVCKRVVKLYGDVAPPNKVCPVATRQKRKAAKQEERKD